MSGGGGGLQDLCGVSGSVFPAKAGIQFKKIWQAAPDLVCLVWVPAFAGKTGDKGFVGWTPACAGDAGKTFGNPPVFSGAGC